MTPLQPLPYPLRQLPLSKLPRIQESLLRQLDIPHTRHILSRGPANARRDGDGVGLEDDSVVDELVNGQGDEVVVFDDGALVDTVFEEDVEGVAEGEDDAVVGLEGGRAEEGGIEVGV